MINIGRDDSTVIETPYGLFIVSDSRQPDDDDEVVCVRSVEPTFKINNKTYGDGWVRLVRGYGGVYLNTYLSESLSESANTKLTEVLTPLLDLFPVLTREEKVDRLVESARSAVTSKLRYEVARAFDRPPFELTETERAKIDAAITDTVRAWIATR